MLLPALCSLSPFSWTIRGMRFLQWWIFIAPEDSHYQKCYVETDVVPAIGKSVPKWYGKTPGILMYNEADLGGQQNILSFLPPPFPSHLSQVNEVCCGSEFRLHYGGGAAEDNVLIKDNALSAIYW